MKPLMTALLLILAPVAALAYDISSVTPTLTYPVPAPETVTQDDAGIDK